MNWVDKLLLAAIVLLAFSIVVQFVVKKTTDWWSIAILCFDCALLLFLGPMK